MKRDFEKYNFAKTLRFRGLSYNAISQKLKVSKSTLSGWLSKIRLSAKSKKRLSVNKQKGLEFARKFAVQANLKKTIERFRLAENKAEKEISRLGSIFYERPSLHLFLGGLYLGEGAKTKSYVCFANSSPELCIVFIKLFRTIPNIDENKFRCHLHLRADQNIKKMIRFWSELLTISSTKFHKSQIDKRTAGTPTINNYKGVCAIYYYDANIQKYLLSLGKIAVNKIKNLGAVSSVG